MNTLAVDALSVFRLTRLVTGDKITEPLRDQLHRAAWRADSIPVAKKIETLVSCPWCVSWWIAVMVVSARRLAPSMWDPVARALAFSAATGLIAENLD